MSIRVMTWVFGLRNIDPRDKFILLAYADHADDDGSRVFPAVETVADKTCYDARTVQRSTRKLEEIGLLIRDGRSRYLTNAWRINLDWDDRDKADQRGVTLSPVMQTGDTRGDTRGDRGGVTQTPNPLTINLKPLTSTVDTIPVANTTEEVIEHDNSTVVEEQEGESTEKENGRLYAVQQGQNPPDLENTETIEQSFDRQTKAQLKLPRMTAEEHKAMTLQSMVRGQEWSKETREYIRKRFLLNIKWEWKSSQEFLENIRREPPERTIQRFADWWYSEEWRGKQGQPPPSLEEIWKLWPRAFENVTPIREPYVDEYGAGHL